MFNKLYKVYFWYVKNMSQSVNNTHKYQGRTGT